MKALAALRRHCWRRLPALLRGAALVAASAYYSPAAAQPAPPVPVWEISPRTTLIDYYRLGERDGIKYYYTNLVRFPAGRLGTLGTDFDVDARFQPVLQYPLLTVYAPTGDSLYSVRYRQAGPYMLSFDGATITPDGQLTGTTFDNHSASVPALQSLYVADTLGTARVYSFSPTSNLQNVTYGSEDYIERRVLPLPNGYLSLFLGVLPSNGQWAGEIVTGLQRTSSRGQERYRRFPPQRRYGVQFRHAQPLADGSYLLAGFTTTEPPRTNFPKTDHWFVQARLSGDTLRTAQRGNTADWERVNLVRPTPDGGYLVAGTFTRGPGGLPLPPGAGGGMQAQIVKYDRDFHVLWQKSFFGWGRPDYDACHFYGLQPTADGGALLWGTATGSTAVSPNRSAGCWCTSMRPGRWCGSGSMPRP